MYVKILPIIILLFVSCENTYQKREQLKQDSILRSKDSIRLSSKRILDISRKLVDTIFHYVNEGDKGNMTVKQVKQKGYSLQARFDSMYWKMEPADRKQLDDYKKAIMGNYEKEKAFKEDKKNKYIRIGMTKEMVLEIWGKPLKVNKTTTAYNINEQWVYNNNQYIYFDNGILTAIQQ